RDYLGAHVITRSNRNHPTAWAGVTSTTLGSDWTGASRIVFHRLGSSLLGIEPLRRNFCETGGNFPHGTDADFCWRHLGVEIVAAEIVPTVALKSKRAFSLPHCS